MPYCSIEEAWGTPFISNNQKKDDDNVYLNIVPDNADLGESEFSDVDFKKKLYQSQPDEKKKKKKRRSSFSRNMNRLPHHSGPNNRYADSKNNKKLVFKETKDCGNKTTKVLVNEAPISYKNEDTPISNYNKNLEQDLYDSQSISNMDIEIESEDEEDDKEFELIDEEDLHSEAISYDDEDNEQIEDLQYLNDKKNMHKRLTNKITTSLRNNRKNKKKTLENYKDLNYEIPNNNGKENLYDIIVYVITGIFIIFILDLFVRMGRNV